MDRLVRSLILSLAILLLVAGCAGGAGPSSSPSPSVGDGPVTTEEQAIARVIAHEPRLAGIVKRDPDMIGQSSWYEATPASGVGVVVVTVRIGWGDCQAGCIDEHTWVYAVGPDGSVTLQSEGGGAVPDSAWPGPVADGQAGRTGILVTAVAGPTCPVETVAPDPACAPRPVASTLIDVADGTGRQIARQETDVAGTSFFEVPPGVYVVTVADTGEQFFGVPEPQKVEVVAGAVAPVTIAFDTGIR
jgi:hypothetical protein